MYTNSNSLGIGTTGNTYNLVPNNMRMPPISYKHHGQAPQFNSPPQQPTQHAFSNNTQSNLQVNQVNKMDEPVLVETPTIESKPDAVVDHNGNVENDVHQNKINHGEKSQIETNTDKNVVSSPNIPHYWNELFQNVCSNQLYGAFRKIKGIINNSSYFDQTKLVYINYEAMQSLIGKAKRDRSKRGLMSLKTYLNMDNQDIVDITQLDNTLNLIHVMEIMGPPDHAIIALDGGQLNYLKENNFHEYYWPNGNNGITWITRATSDNWSN